MTHNRTGRALEEVEVGCISNKDLLIAASTIWVVVAAVLVMFMQAGFAFLEAGLTRMKNVGHIAGKNVLIFALCSIVYWLVGFGIAFGDGGGGFVGTAASSRTVDELIVDRQGALRLVLGDPGRGRLPVRGRLRRRLARDRLGRDGRADEALGLLRLRRRTSRSSTRSSRTGSGARTAGCSRRGCRTSPARRSSTTRARSPRSPGRSCSGRESASSAPDGKREPDPGPQHALRRRSATIILWFGWFGFNPGSTLSVDFGGFGYFAYVALTTNIAAAAGALGGDRHGVARPQEAGHLDDAERRDRRARRDHGRVRRSSLRGRRS